jgi:hypothetical protein
MWLQLIPDSGAGPLKQAATASASELYRGTDRARADKRRAAVAAIFSRDGYIRFFRMDAPGRKCDGA